MVARLNLHASAQERMARILAGQYAQVRGLQTRPHGVKDLGDTGDLVWSGPELVEDSTTGGYVPGPTYQTWSVRETPRLVAGLVSQRLSEAAVELSDARVEIAAMQDRVEDVILDVGALDAAVGSAASGIAQAQQDAAQAAQTAAQAAQTAAQAQGDAAQALAELATMAGTAGVLFADTEPPGAAETLWINTTNGQPYLWDGSAWIVVTDTRIAAAAAQAQAAQTAAAQAAQDAAQAAQDAAAAQATAAAAGAAAQAAQAAAAAAQTTAAAAQSDADTAAQAAADAAGIAGAKADILIQPDTPPEDMRRASTLWIDTTGGANTPKRWTGTGWVQVTDKTATDAAQAAVAAQAAADAAQAAAQAAQAAADAAQQTADQSATAAAQALTSANGRNARIVSLNPPTTATTHPRTGLPLGDGDTWWQWDGTTSRNVIGAWVREDGEWVAEALGDAVLAALDVNKLVVLGEARITEAVIGKLFGDAAFFNAIKVEDLTVTAGAVVDDLVAQAIAAAIIAAQVFRTEVDPTTGLYAIMDSFGFRVIDNDGPAGDGEPVTLIELGPSGANLLQLGDPATGTAVIDSSGGVSAQRGAFQELYLAGEPLQQALNRGPRGVISFAGIPKGNYSRQLQGQNIIIGLDADLERGRVYEVQLSSMLAMTETPQVRPELGLHVTLDRSYPGDNWSGSRVAELFGPVPGWNSIPGYDHIIDLRHLTGSGTVLCRVAVTLRDRADVGWAQISTLFQPAQVKVVDLGDQLPDRGRVWLANNATPPAAKQRYVKRWQSTSWATYFRGGARDTSAGAPTQGQYSTWNRECAWFFNTADITATLAGATVNRVTAGATATHWNYGDGGIGSFGWHGHSSPPGSNIGINFLRDEGGPSQGWWPRGQERIMHMSPADFGAWQNGTRKGFGFATPSTGLRHYGKFAPGAWLEVEYEK